MSISDRAHRNGRVVLWRCVGPLVGRGKTGRVTAPGADDPGVRGGGPVGGVALPHGRQVVNVRRARASSPYQCDRGHENEMSRVHHSQMYYKDYIIAPLGRDDRS